MFFTAIIHREMTQHYRECRDMKLMAAQMLTHVTVQSPQLYQGQYRRPCRHCARCEHPGDNESSHSCCHCYAYYCSTACRESDRERHEVVDDECVGRVSHQLPPTMNAESVRSSILMKDLLAHA